MAEAGSRPRRIASAIMLVILFSAADHGPAEGAMIGREPVADTRVARTPEEALRMAGEALPRSAGRMMMLSQYPFMSDLILPLKDMGILTDLLVVLPSEKPLRAEALDGIRPALADEGVSPSDLGTFSFDRGIIRGSLGGIPCALIALPSIPYDPQPATVVVDTAFLLGVYRSEATMPMVDLAGKLVVTLRSRKVDATSVILLDAAPRADFPLEEAGLATLLREWMVSPKDFDPVLPEKWKIRKRADLLYFFLQKEEAAGLYRQWLQLEPSDASAAYRLAWLAAWERDVDRSLGWLEKAAAADPVFRRGYPEIARYFQENRRAGAAERILRSGLARFPEDPLLSTELARHFVRLGDAASSRGARNEADEYYRIAASVDGADPGVRDEAASKRGAAVPPLRGPSTP